MLFLSIFCTELSISLKSSEVDEHITLYLDDFIMNKFFKVLKIHFIKLLKIYALNLFMEINIRNQYLFLTIYTIFILLRYLHPVIILTNNYRLFFMWLFVGLGLLDLEMIDYREFTSWWRIVQVYLFLLAICLLLYCCRVRTLFSTFT